MTPRERIRAVLRRQQPDRVPRMTNFYPTAFGPHPGRPAEVEFETDIRFVTLPEPEEQIEFMRYLKSLPADTYVGSREILRTYHDWGYHPEIERDARLGDADTIETIAAAPLPDFMARVKPERLHSEVECLHALGYPVMASPPHLGGDFFEPAVRLRGFEQFMIDLVSNPPLVDHLMEQLTAMHLSASLALTRAGIDILALDDDVAERRQMLMSRTMWQRYFKPHVKTLIDTCRRAHPELAIFWHSDGNIEAIIPDLIEIGVDILNPVQPDSMDPAKLKRVYGGQLTFFGTVGTAQLWSRGTPEGIRAEVRERIATVGKGGGLIIAPAYDLEPAAGIPWANVTAFFDAVEEFGAY
jgi:uroporphyrinogen decarboxylase